MPARTTHRSADESEINVYPANYKAEILAGMHAYLNDPTGIREPGVSEPVVKSVGSDNRYLVCVRFNGKRRGNEYAGVREIGAVFVAGRFDRFVERCASNARARPTRHSRSSESSRGSGWRRVDRRATAPPKARGRHEPERRGPANQ